jgi:PPOX class probable F420-dependent enzyme
LDHPVITDEVRRLLQGLNFAHVATLLPDGSPHAVTVWILLLEDDRVAFFTQPESRKARNVGRDPRVAISVTDRENPYRMGWLRGRVGETLTGEEALRVIDRLSEKYTGGPFPMRSGVVFIVDVERSSAMTLPFDPPGPPGHERG